MMDRVFSENGDKKISMALLSSVVILTIQFFIIIVFNLMDTSMASIIQIISKVIVGLFYLYALPIVIQRNKTKFIIIYFSFSGIFLIHYLIFPSIRIELASITVTFFTMALPSFIYALSLRGFHKLTQIMKKASLLVFVLGLILGGLIILKISNIGEYSMALSYYMLLPALVYLNDLLTKFSVKSLLVVVSSTIVILALGSRGAIICIVVLGILKFVKFGSRLSTKSFLWNIFLVSIAGITLINIERILTNIYELLLNYGINSRSIKLFLGDDLHLSGRDLIYEKVLNELSMSPIIGMGIGADRVIIGNGYVHNIFLEILLNFGIIVGGAIILVILSMLIKVLLEKNNPNYDIYIIWISFGFIHLMVSSSYWIDQKFWILLGILVNGLFLQKNVHAKNYKTL